MFPKYDMMIDTIRYKYQTESTQNMTQKIPQKAESDELSYSAEKEQEYSYSLRIPKDRVAVLIGKKGEVKKRIEQETMTEIIIDSKEGEIIVSGRDAIRLYTTREIIKAIGRGFNPEIAMLLLKQDYLFEIIDISDFGSTRNHILRLKGRLIGAKGKSRLFELSETNISVYGKTVSIIGDAERVPAARKALENLLKGSPHAKVYNWLEKMRIKLKKEYLNEI